MSISRRNFLAGTAAGIAGLGAIPMRHVGGYRSAEVAAPRTPFPYVDGLTFLADKAPVGESGLSALICDVSSIEETKPAVNDGAVRYVRSFQSCARSITAMRRGLAGGAIPGAFLATRGSEIRSAWESGRTAVFFQFQGADPIGEELSRLDLFYELGLRVLQITHHNNNAWGGGAIEKSWRGLTRTGVAGVERLNELGIIPDLSHVGDASARDVLRMSRKPVIISHGAVRAIVNNARCAPDDVIRGVANTGGVMGVFMMSFWLTDDASPTVETYVRQLRHIRNVAGIDAVAIANDYDIAGLAVARAEGNAAAAAGYQGWWDGVAHEGVLGFGKRLQHVVIPELNDIRRAFSIHQALERAGFTPSEVEKVMGGNWSRVLTSTLG